ncbi:hypothetical protein [Actinocatenispora comari]|uniref:Uncharacterized protein n=1 Tax=Actinocatenispora comari TaxID=2807577 RepID=A0A8J4AK75_9ACTN|nr:hypothetical protein [Actinocatenispora comari]GIL31287.1 hypothetical protein NUM_65410 [Actinocatenispora comari]
MMLRGEHILVRAAGDPAVAAIQVATFLSSILFAGLMLGNAAGLAAVRAFAGHDGTALLGRAARRTVLAVLGGLVAGVVSGGAAYLLEADLHSGDRLLVGTSIAISALLGGAAAALRPGLMVAAGVLGTLVVLAVLALRSVFITPLTRLFGGEGTIQKYASAQSTLALVSFVVAGVVAGVAIHLYARRTGNRLRIASTIGAGATAGVFTLVGLALTWVFDRQLISSAGGLDLGDQLAFHIAGMYQLNGGLALLFAGAIVALLLYGRTRGPRRPRRPKRPTGKPEWAVREERRAAELDRTARADSATGKTSTGNKSSAGRSATGRTGTGKAATGKSATAGKTTTTDKTSASGKGSAGDKNPASDKTATSGKGSAGGKNPTSGKAATSDKSSAGGKAGAGANSSAGGNGAGGNGAGGKGAAGRKPGGNKSSGAKTAGATAPGGKTAGGTESGGTESGGTASGGTAGTAEAEGAAGAEATDTGNASTGSTAQPAGNRRRART